MQDGTVVWISQLRGRLARGELDRLPPIDLGDESGHFPAAHTVRIMLHDLDDLDAFDRRRRGNGAPPSDDILEEYRVRRLELLAAFQRLRDLIG